MNKDVRWIQRVENFKKAFKQLEEAVELHQKRGLSDLEKQGMDLNGEIWMEMIDARNLTSYTYDKKMSERLIKSITEKYV